MTTTSTTLQALIDAKAALIADIVAKITVMNTTIATITASPRPSYSIGGQEFDFNSYLNSLTKGVKDLGDLQNKEIQSINDLISTQMRLAPFQYISRGV